MVVKLLQHDSKGKLVHKRIWDVIQGGLHDQGRVEGSEHDHPDMNGMLLLLDFANGKEVTMMLKRGDKVYWVNDSGRTIDRFTYHPPKCENVIDSIEIVDQSLPEERIIDIVKKDIEKGGQVREVIKNSQ